MIGAPGQQAASRKAGNNGIISGARVAPGKRLLIVFTRHPEPGRAKTRLIPLLGAEGAADLQRQMTLRTIVTARRAQRRISADIDVRYSGGDPSVFGLWLGPDLSYRPQGGGDLGRRMAESFGEGFAAGAAEVVIIGADIPNLTEDLLERAFASLAGSDLVLGPALDGGYYLIGLRRAIPELFEAIAWGAGEVLGRTLELAERLGLSVAMLDPLPDVDEPEDISAWQAVSAWPPAAPGQPKISIVIPTLNEAGGIGALLADLLPEPGVELIVADGGSDDSTRDVATAYGARVVQIPPGRARQMNAGAQAASGEILLFLHADTRLPWGFGDAIRAALARRDVAGGAFAFRLDTYSLALRLIEWATNLRSIWLQLPYGDQALFIRTRLFHELGGYPEEPVMEDVLLVRRLRRFGRIVTLGLPAVTSARRWRRLGVWRTTLIHLVAMAAYCVGASPVSIARWYRHIGYYRRPDA